MADKPVVVIDLNIVLDVLQKREQFFVDSAQILAAAETGKIDGYLAAHSITTLFNILQKSLSSGDARASITNLLQILKIAPIDQKTIDQALNLDYQDFEDAVQMMAAVQTKADCIVTRNLKDYQPALLPVYKPIDFLKTI